MQSNHKPSTSKPKKQIGGFNNHANFIEALKSSGSSMVKDTAKTLVDDVLVGSAKQMGETIFNASGNQSESNNFEQQDDFDFAEFMRSSEMKNQSQKVKYEYEQQETVIFNRRQEEINGKIEEIRIELKKLAAEIVNLNQSTQTAISQELVDPGTYHLNYFEKMLIFIRRLRKSAAESRNWSAMHNQRGKAKSYFWQQASNKVGGTKFLLSQERQVATQTG